MLLGAWGPGELGQAALGIAGEMGLKPMIQLLLNATKPQLTF